MSDKELKPLIFLLPLSETLKKLREVIDEIASQEGIEVHDTTSIGEVTQIIPILGQSLKVKLQLRSIISKEETSNLELRRSKSKIEQHEEKTITQKKESESLSSQKQKPSFENIDPLKGTHDFNEESSPGHYKGSVDQQSHIQEENESYEKKDLDNKSTDKKDLTSSLNQDKSSLRKSKYQEDQLGGVYQGEVSNQQKDDNHEEKKDLNVEKENSSKINEKAKNPTTPVKKENTPSHLKASTEKKSETGHSEEQEKNASSFQLPKGQSEETQHKEDKIHSLQEKEETPEEKPFLDHDPKNTKKKDHKSGVDTLSGSLTGKMSQEKRKNEKAKKEKSEDESEHEQKDYSHHLEERELKEKGPTFENLMRDDFKDKKLDLEFEDCSEEKEDKEKKESDKKKSSLAFSNTHNTPDLKGKNQNTTHDQSSSNKSNAKSDRLKTHYSNKSHNDLSEDDEQTLWRPPTRLKKTNSKASPPEHTEADEENKKTGEVLDYTKIKEEFGLLNGGGPSQENDGYQFEIDNAEIKTIKQSILDPDGHVIKMDFECIDNERLDDVTEIYQPDTKNLEYNILVLDTYYSKPFEKHIIYKEIAKHTYNLYDCDVIFYHVKNNTTTLIFNGFINNRIQEPIRDLFEKEELFQEVKEEYLENKTIYDEEWEEIEKHHLTFWKSCTSPLWSDPKFLNYENFFIFPFFDKQTKLGFIVVKPQSKINLEVSKPIESIVETARAYYLGQQKNNRSQKSTSKSIKKTKKKGFFYPLIKKLVG